MIVWKNKSIETHSNEEVYADNVDCYIIDSPLSEKVRNNYPYYDLVVDNGKLIDVSPFNPISVTTDKPNNQITADGSDTATITATVGNPDSTEMIELWNEDVKVDEEQAFNGIATFEVTMTEPGELVLTVKSTTKYGQNSITITGV